MTSLCAKRQPRVKKNEHLPTPHFFSFSHPKFGGFLHLQDVGLKGGIQERHGFLGVLRAFPRLSIQGFSLKENTIFFSISNFLIMVKVGFGLQNPLSPITLLVRCINKPP